MTDRAAQLAELTVAHQAAYRGILAATDGLDDAAWARATGCPGWDVRAQLSHVIGVERMVLGDAAPDVEVGEVPHAHGELGRTIERDVAVRLDTDPQQLRAEATEVFDRRLRALRAMAPEELEQEIGFLFGPTRWSTVLRMRLFDLSSHERDIRAALGSLEGLGGPHVEHGVEQTLRAWASNLPTRLERTATVVFDVVGGPSVALELATGLMTRDTGLPSQLDATLRLAPADVLAIGGGRDDAPDTDALEVTGDLDLVAAVLAAATITP